MNKIDNIYVINMEESQDRLLSMKKELSNAGLNFTRIDAVNGNKLTSKEVKDLSTLTCSVFCTNGIIGCFLSHKKTWEKMIENGDRYAIIMEDDCKLEPNFVKDLDTCLNELNELIPDWDMFYCGCFGGCKVDRDYTIFQRTIVAFNSKLHQNKSVANAKHIYVPEAPVGLHCYILSNNCARKLLKYLNKASYHVDVEMVRIFKEYDFKVFSSKKILAYQLSTADSSVLTKHKFPVLINKYVDPIHDDFKISYSYYLSTPIMEVASFPVNVYFIIFAVLSMAIPKKHFKKYITFVLIYLFTEFIINPKYYYLISVWLAVLYSVYHVKLKS